MATRIETIIKNARYTLADQAKDRYSDERLLTLVDEAHKDFARQTKLLKGEVEIPIFSGQTEYDLPLDVYQILRCSSESFVLPMTSFDDMDEFARRQWTQQSGFEGVGENPNYALKHDNYGFAWETQTGSRIEAVIIDKRMPHKIRIWPIPTDTAETSYEFIAGGAPEVTGQQLLGVVTSITDYTLTSPYGEVTGFVGPQALPEQFSSLFGVVTDIAESALTLRIQYVKTPADVTSVNDELLTAPQWDVALMRYVIGQAFRDDLDTQYRQRGAEELGLYAGYVQEAKTIEATNSARSPNLFTVAYRTPFS